MRPSAILWSAPRFGTLLDKTPWSEAQKLSGLTEKVWQQLRLHSKELVRSEPLHPSAVDSNVSRSVAEKQRVHQLKTRMQSAGVRDLSDELSLWVLQKTARNGRFATQLRYYVEEFKKAFSKPQPYETEAALQIVKAHVRNELENYLAERSPVPVESVRLTDIPDHEIQSMIKRVKASNFGAGLPDLSDTHIHFWIKYKLIRRREKEQVKVRRSQVAASKEKEQEKKQAATRKRKTGTSSAGPPSKPPGKK